MPLNKKINDILSRFSQATIKAAMAERPEIMQASGWDYDKEGNLVQGDPNADGPRRLASSLAEIASIPMGDMIADVAGAAIAGSKAYKSYKAARALKKAVKSSKLSGAFPVKADVSPEHNIFRGKVYKGGEITDPYFASFTTDPKYAAQYGEVKPYIIETKGPAYASEPLMGSRDVVANDMFYMRNTGESPKARAIIGHDMVTPDVPYQSQGMEIFSYSPHKEVKPYQETGYYLRRHEPASVQSVIEPKADQISRLIRRAEEGLDPPLQTKMADLFGGDVDIPKDFAAAMRLDEFKAAYPEGVDIWYRGLDPLEGAVKGTDWRQAKSSYPAMFGGDRTMAQSYVGQGVSPDGDPGLLTLITPKGKIVDVGDLGGAHWQSLTHMKHEVDAQDAILKGLYGKAKRLYDAGDLDNYAKVWDEISKAQEARRSLFGIEVPGLEGKFNSTDQIAAALKREKVPGGVLLRNIDDGPVANEVIWNHKLITPKAIHPQQTYTFNLFDGSYLNNGGLLLNPYAGGGPLKSSYKLPQIIVTPDKDYSYFLNSLPDNQRLTPESDYSTRRYWELNGKPKDFNEAKKLGMYTYDSSDNSYHANTIAWGDDGIGYFMKPRHHDTVKYELDWFNNGIVTEEGGRQHEALGDDLKEWEEFRKNYDIDTTGNFYKYIPKQSYSSGGKIHIKPSKRGTFTAAAKKHGKSVQAFASQVLAHKENYSPAMVKKANFARNAAKWHAEGGSLDNTIDYTGINTTNHRKYNPDYISYIDTSLANADISPAKRASILANIIEESGGNPFALDDTGKFYGLLQWADDRYKVTGEKDPYKEIDNQVNHILNTLGNTTDKVSWTHGGTGSGYNSYKDAMMDFDSDDLATAMKGFTLGYVRPTGKMDSYNNRLKVAEQLLQRYNSTPLQKVTNLAGRLNKAYGGDMSAILKLIGSASGGIR